VSSTDKIFGGEVKSEGTAPPVNDPCKIFYGTQMCYLFLRMHHTIFSRLCEAKNLSDSMRRQQAKADLSLAAMDVDGPGGDDEKSHEGITTEKRRLAVYTTKPAYQSFLGQLYGVIDGSVDNTRYEESCRQLLGNRSFVLLTLDKVVQHALKCLQAMANDDNVNKLIGLFVYHRCRGIAAATAAAGGASSDLSSSLQAAASVDPVLYHNHVAHILGHTMEDVYRLQYVSRGHSEGDGEGESEHVVCQCLGSISANDGAAATAGVTKTPALNMPDAEDEEEGGNDTLMQTGDNAGEDAAVAVSQSPHSTASTSPRSFHPIGVKIEADSPSASPAAARDNGDRAAMVMDCEELFTGSYVNADGTEDAGVNTAAESVVKNEIKVSNRFLRFVLSYTTLP
jgi:hypothetical protein